MIKDALDGVELDEYDRLIQLCDSIAGYRGEDEGCKKKVWSLSRGKVEP